jgi:hypothetical protein
VSRRACALLALGMLAAQVHADPLYVVEQLVVNVNSAPDASGERIATLKSGDRVEALERSGDQVHVRLPGGRDGWVRSSYLSADEPLRVRLTQREAELTQAKEQLAALQQQLNSAAARTSTVPEPSAVRTEEVRASGAAMFSGAQDEPQIRRWPWTLAGALVGLGIGFALGVLVLDRHIRRRYGGLKIY